MRFTEEQKKKISDAVKEVELHTSGEIVPYFVGKSDDYREVRFYMSTLFGIGGCLIVALLSVFWQLPIHITPLMSSIYVLSLMLIGFCLTLIFPQLIRFFVPESNIFKHIITRAEAAFLEEEVFNTRDRTGILIFISNLERQALVLGDTGINSKVKKEDWEDVISHILDGIKKKDLTQGIIDAIKDCKDLLLDNGFIIKPDDTNELSNEIRIKE